VTAQALGRDYADVLIVGAGPAGLSAATRLKELGIGRVVVIEREPVGGGIPRHCGHPPFGMREFGRVLTGPAYAQRLVDRAIAAGVDLRLRWTVLTIENDDDVVVTCASSGGTSKIAAKRVIIATGVRERPRSARLVSGDRPIGVLNTGAFQEYVYLQHLVPFRRPLIVGTELVSLSSLLTCRKIGARPVAMIEGRDRPTVRRTSMMLPRLLGIPVHYGTRVVDIKGKPRVEAVTVRRADGVLADIACDGVLFTGCFTPESALTRAAGIEIDTGTGGPVIDQFARTSSPRIFAAGNVLRPVETAGWSWREGRRIAQFVALDLKAQLPEHAPTLRVTAGPGIRYVVPQRLVPGGGGLKHIQLRAAQDVSGKLCIRSGGREIGTQSLSTSPERRILLPAALVAEAEADVTIGFDGVKVRSDTECA
jgi:thioredoxin reductase